MTIMRLKRLSLLASFLAAFSALLFSVGSSATGSPAPAQTPQRTVSEQWVAFIGEGDLRGACEIQAAQVSAGQACETLPLHSPPSNCPLIRAGATPRYRKSEIRTTGEQVGNFTEETPTRGFIRVNAQVKAKKLWGVLGLEQIARVWRTTYLRYGGETFVPAWATYQSEAWHKLWISNWCPTKHPRYQKKR
jgi:hypothetical protein